MKDEQIRFFNQVEYSADCWIWRGAQVTKGYGAICVKRNGKWTNIRAHRYSYEYFVGPLADKLCCHHCDNPLCVNPFHLYSGTPKENTRDMVERKRNNNQKKTHCKRGHEFTPENTRILKNGHRDCKKCRVMHSRKYRREHG